MALDLQGEDRMSINLAEFPSGLVSYYQNNLSEPQLQGLPRPEPLNLKLYFPSSKQRTHVEEFISRHFYRKHGAHIRHYMPCLLALENSGGDIFSATGFRVASGEQLFLENYLEVPIEKILAQKTGNIINRDSVIEAGNLASGNSGSSRLMIMAMTYLLDQKGFEWVVMTGTNELLNIFRNLDLELEILERAEVRCLADNEQLEWGTYYSKCPHVMTGNVRLGNSRLMKSIAYRNFISSLRGINLPPCSGPSGV